MEIIIKTDKDMQAVYIQASTRATGVEYPCMNKYDILNALKDYLQYDIKEI